MISCCVHLLLGKQGRSTGSQCASHARAFLQKRSTSTQYTAIWCFREMINNSGSMIGSKRLNSVFWWKRRFVTWSRALITSSSSSNVLRTKVMKMYKCKSYFAILRSLRKEPYLSTTLLRQNNFRVVRERQPYILLYMESVRTEEFSGTCPSKEFISLRYSTDRVRLFSWLCYLGGFLFGFAFAFFDRAACLKRTKTFATSRDAHYSRSYFSLLFVCPDTDSAKSFVPESKYVSTSVWARRKNPGVASSLGSQCRNVACSSDLQPLRRNYLPDAVRFCWFSC